MKQVCINCHFLAKELNDGTGKTSILPWNDEDRSSSTIGDDYSAKCYQRVWDESIDVALMEQRSELISMDRHHACFFYPKTRYMMFSVANELQKRTQDVERLQDSNRSTRVALWIAVLALIVNTAVELLVAWR